MRPIRLAPLCILSGLLAGPTATFAAPQFINELRFAGNATDATPGGQGSGVNINRLGGFASDLYYDRLQNAYYGLVDRGPGGGTIGYDTRVQKFTLDIDPATGAIGNFNLLSTINFRQPDGTPFNGFRPDLDPLNGNKAVVGRSFDPEGFVVGKTGSFFVADEYGPGIKEFNAAGTLVRPFTTPDNLVPRLNGVANFAGGRPDINMGRQDNRGYEGLTISPDGNKLFAVLQDPLVNEGVNEGAPDGRRSRNVRIVQFDVATGASTGQFIYQLESLADINGRVPTALFGANSQGRNIGVSAIIALNDHEFLVIERDNRGVGVEDPLGTAPVASKRVYKIDITGATDVSAVDLTGVNDLPAGVTPVTKSLYLDVAEALLQQVGLPITEKLEGITVGPQLADGTFALVLGTDNDFSVTQNSDGIQFDVCAGDGATSQVPVDSACPSGQSLLPSFLYAFKVDFAADGIAFVPQQRIPLPASLALMLVGLAALRVSRRGQRRPAQRR